MLTLTNVVRRAKAAIEERMRGLPLNLIRLPLLTSGGVVPF
jgi:hypothetical protein